MVLRVGYIYTIKGLKQGHVVALFSLSPKIYSYFSGRPAVGIRKYMLSTVGMVGLYNDITFPPYFIRTSHVFSCAWLLAAAICVVPGDCMHIDLIS